MTIPRDLLLDEQNSIGALTSQLVSDVDRVHSTEADAHAKVQQPIAESEPFKLMGRPHHVKVEQQFAAEWRQGRILAAGARRFDLEPRIDRFAQNVHAFIERRKRDVSVTMPDALDRVTPDGMIALALLRESRTARIDSMSAADLHAVYQSALARRDAAALVDLELIEARVGRGNLASSMDERPAVKALVDHVEGVQELRVPVELNEAAEVIEAARQAVRRAQRHEIEPVNPAAAGPDVARAIEQERERAGAAA